MTGIAEDQDAARELVAEEYFRLQKLDPHHELLCYLENRVGDYYFASGKAEEFDTRFADERWKRRETPMTLKLCHYHTALKQAANETNSIRALPLFQHS